MSKTIDDIVTEIYDPVIENPKRQQFMRSVIKAWIRQAYFKGIDDGKEILAIEMRRTLEKTISPDAIIVLNPRNHK